MRIGYFSCFVLLICPFLYSQSTRSIPPDLELLTFDNVLPDDLISSRAIVFIDVPPVASSHVVRGQWHDFAHKAHEHLKTMGVDAVAYYNLNDFFAGIDATASYHNSIQPREIENLIFIRRKEEILGEVVELVIAEKKSDQTLILPNQNAYRVQRNALNEVMLQLARDVYQNKLTGTNFLISDKPEFFEDTDAVKGRRYENFTGDLRISKLAVPVFSEYRLPSNFDSSQLSSQKIQLLENYNRQVWNDNELLAEIMTSYPYEYELVDYAQGEEHLYRREFSYVLMFLHSTGRNVKKLLNYEINLNETDYITLRSLPDGVTTLEQIPIRTQVYKFYIKQLVNKEIYLGNEWDADLTWDQALTNYLNNLKDALESENN